MSSVARSELCDQMVRRSLNRGLCEWRPVLSLMIFEMRQIKRFCSASSQGYAARGANAGFKKPLTSDMNFGEQKKKPTKKTL